MPSYIVFAVRFSDEINRQIYAVCFVCYLTGNIELLNYNLSLWLLLFPYYVWIFNVLHKKYTRLNSVMPVCVAMLTVVLIISLKISYKCMTNKIQLFGYIVIQIVIAILRIEYTLVNGIIGGAVRCGVFVCNATHTYSWGLQDINNAMHCFLSKKRNICIYLFLK